jgi:hypothetical protein
MDLKSCGESMNLDRIATEKWHLVQRTSLNRKRRRKLNLRPVRGRFSRELNYQHFREEEQGRQESRPSPNGWVEVFNRYPE